MLALAASLAMTPVAKAESVIEALAFAYANNAAIASALLSVKMAAEDIAIRSAGQRPQINASGNVTYQWGVAEGTFAHSASGSVAISYSQNLFDNLRTDAQIDQARAMAEAAKQGLRNSEQNVLLSAASAYFAVVRDTQLASSRSENVQFLQAQVDSAEERFRIGEGTSIDVAQAEARLAGAVAAYRSAVSQLQSSQASFARWVGHQANSLSATFPYDRLLPASLEIRLERRLSDAEVDARIESWKALPGVSDVQSSRATVVTGTTAADIVRWVAWALGALTLIASLMVVMTSFQLAAYTRRDEMNVLRLVGAVGRGHGRG